MALIKQIPEWRDSLKELNDQEAAMGGGSKAPINILIKELADRSQYLKANISGGTTLHTVPATWTPVTYNPSGFVYLLHDMYSIGDGNIVRVGGNLASMPSSPAPHASVFDTGTNTIQSSLGWPAGIQISAAVDPINKILRLGHAADVANNPVTSNFDVALNTGSKVPTADINPLSRAGDIVVSCIDSIIRYVGGKVGGVIDPRIVELDPFSRTYNISADVSVPLQGAEPLVANNGRVYFLGGHGTGSTFNNVVYSTDYDLRNPVVEGPFLPDGANQPPVTSTNRVTAKMIAPDTAVVCYANMTCLFIPSKMVFEPLTSSPTNQYDPAIANIGDGRLLVLGGHDGNFIANGDSFILQV